MGYDPNTISPDDSRHVQESTIRFNVQLQDLDTTMSPEMQDISTSTPDEKHDYILTSHSTQSTCPFNKTLPESKHLIHASQAPQTNPPPQPRPRPPPRHRSIHIRNRKSNACKTLLRRYRRIPRNLPLGPRRRIHKLLNARMVPTNPNQHDRIPDLLFQASNSKPRMAGFAKKGARQNAYLP